MNPKEVCADLPITIKLRRKNDGSYAICKPNSKKQSQQTVFRGKNKSASGQVRRHRLRREVRRERVYQRRHRVHPQPSSQQGPRGGSRRVVQKQLPKPKASLPYSEVPLPSASSDSLGKTSAAFDKIPHVSCCYSNKFTYFVRVSSNLRHLNFPK
jgi:hypothetical protein